MSEWRYDESSGTFRRTDGVQEGPGKKKNDGSWLSWGLIIAAFVLWSPLGLILLMIKLFDAPAKKNRSPSAAESKQEIKSESKVAQAAKKAAKTPDDRSEAGKILQIVGALTTALFGLIFLSYAGDALNGMPDWESLLQMAGITAGGLVMFGSGLKMYSRKNRIARYLAVMGKRDYVTVAELAAVTGKKPAVVTRDLDHMIQKNMLETGAFVDAGRGILFRSADAYQRYLTERAKQEDLTPREAQEGYAGALRAIREANDRIPDPDFSEKLDRMEYLTGKIMKEVEEHPEKQKQASTFFNYYLPTTLKLLGTYADFEEAGIEGDNLRQAKERIESIMDNLLENFERQLDELYRSEAMDVDADIRVMESMLDRDLSSVERDFGLNGGAAVAQAEENR